ncbi:PREDICTED: interferon-inducible GTPase 5-like [Nanorana parkeri]|uniref:interferon-inducible GTPase 5-like n=1 Tax=Nanorana parkeri TaxID=125878 RepID=UPI000854A9C9|nr:PREDICTED: interferon-inducible GTPase 5-like [Nanorana parkeri]
MEAKEDYWIINEEELGEIKACLEGGNLYKTKEAISESLESMQLNIAVTGDSGAGKSTFINAIRGLEDDDEDAAKTGVVETTTKVMSYSNPNDKNVIFWDLPGVGTPNFKPEEYLEAVKFHQYDFFIIMTSERFRLNNADLAKEIQAMGKEFYFVRTKVDNDLAASKKQKKKTFNEQNILKEIRENCVQNLRRAGIHEPRVFLLSCLDLDKYDFNLIQETLEKELPSNKRDIFLLALPNLSLSILEKKKQALQRHVWKVSILSCAAATVPLPGLSVVCDITILMTAMKKYVNAFGLTHDSLDKLARKCGKDVAELKSVVKTPLVQEEITVKAVANLIAKAVVSKLGKLMFVKYAISMIPMIGSLVAGGLSFTTTYAVLNKFLEDCAEDAVRVLQKVLETHN